MIARRSLAAALGLSALLAACGAGEKTARAPAAPAIPVCPGAGKHLVKKGTLYVPPGAKPRQTTLLVVVIPGGGGDEGDRLGIVRAARKIGFGVLYPTSEDGGFWQLNDAQGTSDVTDVRDAIEDTLATLCFDRRRVSITGVSNGAGFAARMACEHPAYFAAVAPPRAPRGPPATSPPSRRSPPATARSTRAPPARACRSSTSTAPPTPS